MRLIGIVSAVSGVLALFSVAPASALDLTTEPRGILPAAQQQKLWDAYKTAKECFVHPAYGVNPPQAVPVLKADAFKAAAWVSPFTEVKGALPCEIAAPMNLQPPRPISTVKLDEAYGERHEGIDAAEVWFRHMTTYHRLSRDPVAADLLKKALLLWANGKGMAKGIHVSWGAKPVDYQMMTAILSFVIAAAEIAPTFTADERAVVGPWLNDLVKQVAASRPRDRTDNKVYLTAYVALLWGLMVGDDKPVQDAIFIYKLAIHDMRPDGSWPIDSQRGGMGLHYNSAATSQLVTIAEVLKQARDVDLYSYAVDGRSLHTAVDWMVNALQHPVEVNTAFALPCPNGGDRFGSVDKPQLAFADAAGYLLAYAERFPDSSSAPYINSRYGALTALDEEKNGGAPACLFTTRGRDVSFEPLKPSDPLPTPAVVFRSQEQTAKKTGDDQNINSIILTDVMDAGGRAAQRIVFNIQGEYSSDKGEMVELSFMMNDKLTAKADALEACGANFEVDRWDNGEAHLRINFKKVARSFFVYKTDCIVAVLPPKQGEQVKLLLRSFRDLAIGMVNDGSIDVVKHNGLRDFLGKVAEGKLTVSAS